MDVAIGTAAADVGRLPFGHGPMIPAEPDTATLHPLQPVVGRARRYSFFQLVDLIHRYHGDDLEPGERESPAPERIRFRSGAGLGFPGSDVMGASLPEHAHDSYRMEVSFLGLHGAQSPLPGYYLEDLAWEAAQGHGVRRHFLDFFHHRLLTLFYRSWRKYRYYVRFREGASDGFSSAVFSLLGLGDERLRQETPLQWSRMLAYTGLLVGRSRSPEVVSRIIAHCFDLPSVEIEQWVLRKVVVPQDQRTALGGRNASLGNTTLVGNQVRDCSGKFLVRLRHLSRERFTDFLPGTETYQRLVRLVTLILREPLAWDLELVLDHDNIEPLQLGTSGRLGWNSVTPAREGQDIAPVRLQIRQ